jgi:hypothetical protein
MSSYKLNFILDRFPNFFARGHLLASKNNHGSSHPCSSKHRVSGRYVSKIKNLYLRMDCIQLQIHTSSTCNNAIHISIISNNAIHTSIISNNAIHTSIISNNELHDSALIRLIVALFVGKWDFLIRNCNSLTNKHSAN